MKLFILTVLFFSLPLVLEGCGSTTTGSSTSTSTNSGTSTTSTSAASEVFYVSQFSPASGSVSSPPTSVQIQFNTANVNPTQASLGSNYVMACGSSSIAASSVSYSSGSYYATATFASQSVANGTTCSVVVSSGLYDTSGNYLSGTRQADYYVTASSSFSWSESSYTTYTSAAGGSGGGYFNDVGADGLALSGLNVAVGTYVDGVKGVWSNGSGTESYGSVHGTSPVTASIPCPSGYRITGIFGYYGSLVNAVGVVCKDSSQSQTYQSSLAGAASGTYFSLSCPSGQFATNLYGRSGSLVDQIGLGCR